MGWAPHLTKFLSSPANLNASTMNCSVSCLVLGEMKAEVVSSDLPSTKHLDKGQKSGTSQPATAIPPREHCIPYPLRSIKAYWGEEFLSGLRVATQSSTKSLRGTWSPEATSAWRCRLSPNWKPLESLSALQSSARHIQGYESLRRSAHRPPLHTGPLNQGATPPPILLQGLF